MLRFFQQATIVLGARLAGGRVATAVGFAQWRLPTGGPVGTHAAMAAHREHFDEVARLREWIRDEYGSFQDLAILEYAINQQREGWYRF